MNTSEVLNRAADLIEERGWAEGAGWMGSAETGPLCVEGAMQAAMGVEVGPGYRCPAYFAVTEYLEREPFGLFLWNDKLAHDRVIALLETRGGGHLAEIRVEAKAEAKEQVVATLRAAAVIEAAKENSTPLPIIPIPAAEFDRIAAQRGAVIELDAGGRDVAIVGGVAWEVQP